MYVTHQPCDNCAKALSDAKINNVIIVEQFMKFDTGKLRYSLIPPVATEALAKVLTYGA
jgi:deoxycytidylate deaminase